MAWIQTIEPGDAEGKLGDIYTKIASARSGVAAIHQAQSLNPRAMVAHLDLYKAVMFARSPLSRVTRERIGVVVSVANRCEYCTRHHAEAAIQAGDDGTTVAALSRGESPAGLPESERALLSWAERCTTRPGDATEADMVALRDAGHEDRAILDASLVVAYFNFVNRLVLSLGVHLEGDFQRYCGGDTT